MKIEKEDADTLRDILNMWDLLSNVREDDSDKGYYLMTDHQHELFARGENLLEKIEQELTKGN